MGATKFTYQDFNRRIPVSRETFSRLEVYVGLLLKWQKSINLVGATTIPHIWNRHIIDCAQLYDYVLHQGRIGDLGSGAGLPGLILAIMGIKDIDLIERDTRKAAFLREAARATGSTVRIINKSIESIDLSIYHIVTARAFTPLTALLESLPGGCGLVLLKGGNYRAEIETALIGWEFDWASRASITDPNGVVLTLRNFRRKGQRAYG